MATSASQQWRGSTEQSNVPGARLLDPSDHGPPRDTGQVRYAIIITVLAYASITTANATISSAVVPRWPARYVHTQGGGGRLTRTAPRAKTLAHISYPNLNQGGDRLEALVSVAD